MPDFPLLIFPQANNVVPVTPPGRGSKPQVPNFNTQKRRLAPKFDQLSNSFAELRDNTAGLSPEQALVIETAGSVEDLIQAARRVDGLEWLAEIDIEDIAPHDGFSKLNKENEPVDTPFDGRLYLIMANQRAMEELLSLWRRWDRDKSPFPRGLTKWRYVFEQALDIRRWDTSDRLSDTGILDIWRDEVELKRGTDSYLRCDIELWFRSNTDLRNAADNRVKELIEESNGVIVGQSCIIEEIHFHSIKCDLRPDTVDHVLNGEYSSLFKDGDIQYFRPTGQCTVESVQVEDEAVEAPETEVTGHPVVALLDGAPMLRHQWLDGRIIIDDPDNYAEEYQASEFEHGTFMASLICHGEIDARHPPLARPIYVRPIMKPNALRKEQVPDTTFPEDLIFRAVKRVMEGDPDRPQEAENIVIFNLSICDPMRPFIRELSPWAKLLDWLSWRYNILFVVSTGNQIDDINLGVGRDEFDNLDNEEKCSLTIRSIYNSQRHRKILSPSESINSISIGAIHKDSSNHINLGNRVDILPNNELPSPVSSIGPGHLRSVKPDLVYDGGRQLYDYLNDEETVITSDATSGPGQRVAAPSPAHAPSLNNTTYIRGTSNSAALITRGAARIYDVLEGLIENNPDTPLSSEHIPTMIKALLAHSAQWGAAGETLKQILKNPSNSRRIKRVVSQYIGYGAPDIDKSLECTEQRATALGCGIIQADHEQEFRLYLPPSIRGENIHKRLTITLAWLTPINPRHRKFRRARLYITPPTQNNYFSITRSDADYHQVKNGTLQHETLEGHDIAAFEDGDYLSIRVGCKEDAGPLESNIRYSIAVTLEVAESTRLPIYQEISERIRPAPLVRAR